MSILCHHPTDALQVAVAAFRSANDLRGAVIICAICKKTWEMALLGRHDADAAPVTLPGAALQVMTGGDLDLPMTAKLNGAVAAVTQHHEPGVAPSSESAA